MTTHRRYRPIVGQQWARRTSALAGVVAVTALLGGCTGEDGNRGPAASSPTEVYSINLTVSTVASLPACKAPLAGTTAFVQSPIGLYSCTGTSWLSIPCTTVLAGAVAYASTSETLLACVSGRWTQIPLPSGAPGAIGPMGPAGPRGDTGATGAQGDSGATGPSGTDGTNGFNSLVGLKPVAPGSQECAAGGQKIEIGLDLDRDGTLDEVEVTTTAFVCNGDASGGEMDAGVVSPDAGGGGSDASPGGSDAGGNPANPALLMLACSDDVTLGGTFDGTSWSTQFLGFRNCQGGGAALTVADGQGVGLLSTSTGDLVYTTWFPGGWSVPSLLVRSVRGAPTIAPHPGTGAVASYLGQDFNLYFASFSGGWNPVAEPVGSPGVFSNEPGSIAMSRGTPTIAFVNPGLSVGTMQRLGPNWVSSTVPSAPLTAPKIAALASGPDLMIVNTNGPGVPVFFTQTNGVWSTGGVVSPNLLARQLALVGLPDGGALLAVVGADGKLYAVRFSGGNWGPVGPVAPDFIVAPDASALAVAPGVYGDVAELMFVADRERVGPAPGTALHARLTATGWSVPTPVTQSMRVFATALASFPAGS